MRIEVNKDGSASLFMNKNEWEDLGKSAQWGSGLVKEASGPSVRIENENGKNFISMNRAGWMRLGKIAGFVDEQMGTFNEGDMYGEGQPYGHKDPIVEPGDSTDKNFSDEFEEETIREAIRKVRATMEGIGTVQVPENQVPNMIMSSLEPISDYRKININGETVGAIKEYLENKESQNDAELRRLIALAMKMAGYEMQ